MEELYRHVNIPNFEQVQEELFKAINYDYVSEGLHARNFSEEYITQNCPTLMSWLKPRSKNPLRLLRFNFTPGYTNLPYHIDSSFVSVPFGLNIPVINCKNTKMIWYYCSTDNHNKHSSGRGYESTITPIDISKLEIIKELELVTPCFVRNDIMHNVVNLNNTFRIMFTIRWGVHPTKFRKIEEVIDTTDLFL